MRILVVEDDIGTGNYLKKGLTEAYFGRWSMVTMR